MQAAEARTGELEKQLETAQGSEEAIGRTLTARRAVIGEILAALQRMDRNPPPAVLVSPEDMLGAVRAAMLLGDVLPEMRSETEALAADLADLAAVRKTIAAERDKLAERAHCARRRAAAPRRARRGAPEFPQGCRTGARCRTLAFATARRAGDRSQRFDHQDGGRCDGRRPCRRCGAEGAGASEADGGTHVAALTPFKDPARLAPAIAFADAKGMLPLPVSGTVLKSFGAPDGFGGVEKGISIATRPRAAVSSPTDGWVAFSGPYRTYGQILIINGGGGYYVVLAGLTQVNVVVGQFVLAGEPVASMGDGSAKTAAAIAIGAAQPILYVEFRKDGVAIDPGPWWAKSEQEKVRG